MASSSETLERKALAFRILEEAVATLKLQADPRGDLDTLETAFKEFHRLVLTGMTDLVDLVGGEALYIPVPDFLSDDIGSAFLAARRKEDSRAPVYSAPHTTMDRHTQGLRS
jgi:hypothetical protein